MWCQSASGEEKINLLDGGASIFVIMIYGFPVHFWHGMCVLQGRNVVSSGKRSLWDGVVGLVARETETPWLDSRTLEEDGTMLRRMLMIAAVVGLVALAAPTVRAEHDHHRSRAHSRGRVSVHLGGHHFQPHGYYHSRYRGHHYYVPPYYYRAPAVHHYGHHVCHAGCGCSSGGFRYYGRGFGISIGF